MSNTHHPRPSRQDILAELADVKRKLVAAEARTEEAERECRGSCTQRNSTHTQLEKGGGRADTLAKRLEVHQRSLLDSAALYWRDKYDRLADVLRDEIRPLMSQWLTGSQHDKALSLIDAALIPGGETESQSTEMPDSGRKITGEPKPDHSKTRLPLWTHDEFPERAHRACWLVDADGERVPYFDDSKRDFIAFLEVKIRIGLDATVSVTIGPANCGRWGNCTPQFVFEAYADKHSDQTLVQAAHEASQHLARFYAAFHRVSKHHHDTRTSDTKYMTKENRR